MISTIANVFVDSQDDIMLNLLLMYKTIIIIIRRPIIMSYQIAPLFHLSTAFHTHVQMRIKTKVYFSRPHTSAAEYTAAAALFHCMVRYGSVRYGSVRYGTVRLSSGRLHFHRSLVPL